MFEIEKRHHILFCILMVFASTTNILSMKTVKSYRDIYPSDQQLHNARSETSHDRFWRSNSSSVDIFHRPQVNDMTNKTDFRIKSQIRKYLNHQKPIKNITDLQYDKSKRPFISNSLMKHSAEIQCPPCEKVHCNPRRPRHLRCRGGLVRGVCGCCPVCAKQVEETCGGHWNYLGTCDKGLICEAIESTLNSHNEEDNISTTGNTPNKKHRTDSNNGINNVQGRNEYISKSTKSFQLENSSPGSDVKKEMNGRSKEGRCVPGYELNDSPTSVVKCRPKCTVEFCLEHPKEICSAVDNSEENRSCSGPCQHTSCSACRLVKKVPGCLGCRSEDFNCLKKFGKCLKQEFCSKNQYPCRNIDLYTLSFFSDKEDESNYMFRCFTPNCLT